MSPYLSLSHTHKQHNITALCQPPCGPNAECNPTDDGSYECDCEDGYEKDEDGVCQGEFNTHYCTITLHHTLAHQDTRFQNKNCVSVISH